MRIIFLLTIYVSFQAFAASSPSPYLGQEQRQIKSLSDAEIQDYLEGNGMGYAKAAELNQYPGPRHVLDLAAEMGLSESQVAETEQIYQRMKRSASELGRRLVEKESELDELFRSQAITPEILRMLTADIAMIEAEIRRTHLAAHLSQKAVLSPHQVLLYVQLRGYGAGQSTHQHKE